MKIERAGNNPISHIENKPIGKVFREWLYRKVVKIEDTNGKTYTGIIKDVISNSGLDESVILSDETKIQIQNMKSISIVESPLRLKEISIKKVLKQDTANLPIPQELQFEVDEQKEIDRAIQKKNWKALGQISESAANNGQFDKAIKIAYLIPDTGYDIRHLTLLNISFLAYEQGNFDKFKELGKMFAKNTHSSMLRNHVNEKILLIEAAERTAKSDKIDSLKKFIKKNSSDFQRDGNISESLKILLHFENFDLALQAADLIKDPSLKKEALKYIQGELIKINDLESAGKIDKMLQNISVINPGLDSNEDR